LKTKFIVPEGIEFARGAKAQLARAIASIRRRGNQRLAIIITGPAASGKSRLAEALITHFYGEQWAAPVVGSRDEDRLAAKLDCLKECPALLLEMTQPAAACSSSNVLKVFLSARVWKYRPLFSSKLESFPVVTRVFIVAQTVGSDLARRGIVIHLKGASK